MSSFKKAAHETFSILDSLFTSPMTEVSPSSKKVDEFLSSLSELSQERLREDRQRQRKLQRNIDELASRLNSTSPVKSESNYRSSSLRSLYQISAPDLRFNRSKSVKEDDVAPPLPRRRDEDEEDEPPALPRRSRIDEETPPTLPERKYQDSIGLLHPVARKEPPAKPMKPEKSLPIVHKTEVILHSRDTGPVEHRSFRDIEDMIKSGKASTKTLESASAELPTPKPKPKPAKPDWLSSLSSSKSTVYTKQSPSSPPSAITPNKSKPTSWIDSAVSKSPESKPKTKVPLIKPSKPKHLELHHANAPEPEFMAKFLQLKKPSEEKKVPPVVKPKPKIKSANDDPPAEFQAKFNSIARSTPINPREKTINYEEKDSFELRSKLQKMSPSKPEKPKYDRSTYEQKDSEELRAQLSKMAHKKPPKKPLKKAATETINLLHKESTPDQAPEDLTFENKLGALLSRGPPLAKALTFPQTKAVSKKSSLQDVKTLTHSTKSRAKGPKRKLPKSMQSVSKSKNVPESKPSRESTVDNETVSRPLEDDAPIVKKPPPIKQKPKDIKVKPRVISGELFI